MFQTGRRIRIIPRTYDVHDWNCVEMTPQHIVFRPSARTFVRRLGATLLAAIAIACLTAFAVHVQRIAAPATGGAEMPNFDAQGPMQSLRESMSEGEWQRLQESAAHDRAAREARQSAKDVRWQSFRDAGYAAYIALCALFGVLGIFPPMSILWDRISITDVGRSHIAVTSRGLLSKTSQTSIDGDTRLSVCAAEIVRRRRHAGVSRLGHRWIIGIERTPSLELLGASIGSIEFDVCHQKDRPVEGMRLPPRVREIAEGLQRLTGLAPGPHVIMDYQGSQNSLWARRHLVSSRSVPIVTTRTLIGEPDDGTSRTLRFDEMSPEMQAQFEAFRARAGAKENQTVTAEIVFDGGPITFRDTDGTVHSYRSFDEMPEDVRAIFDMMRRATHGKTDER